jgi:uncharacterized membrane protein YiaA
MAMLSPQLILSLQVPVRTGGEEVLVEADGTKKCQLLLYIAIWMMTGVEWNALVNTNVTVLSSYRVSLALRVHGNTDSAHQSYIHQKRIE